MACFLTSKLGGAACLLALAQPVFAERLSLSFLPPDLPPSNVCNAEPEVREEGELQDGDLEVNPPGTVVLEDAERVRFLSRDIRELSASGAAEWTGYIEALIDWKTEIDPRFSEVDGVFAQIELMIKAGRIDELAEQGLIAEIAGQSDALGNAQKERLARYLRTGLGVEKDVEASEALLVEAGFAGSSPALLTIVRLGIAGHSVSGWDLGLEETATLAFGGVIGQMNRGLCARAERMARAYLDGDILEPNEDLAYAWRVFAADMGGVRAAWRVVEHHLNGTAPRGDHDTLLQYLNLALSGSHALTPADTTALIDSGATTQAELLQMLARAPGTGDQSGRRSAAQYMELQNNPIIDGFAAESDLSRYLGEAVEIPDAPGLMYTRLAREILIRQGRWAGEDTARVLLEEAIRRGDPEAMVQLARLKSRHRDDAEAMNDAEQLLLGAVSQYRHAPAMRALDQLYRCRFPDAPRRSEAEFWFDQYRATGLTPLSISANDVAKLDARLEPDVVAKLQSFAVRGHAASKANLLQLLQSDPLISDEVLRYWAVQIATSDSALEEYAIQEFELALTEAARALAVSLFRRAYLDVGQSISLDLAIALVEHAGRDPRVAEEIRGLLERSARRGEGAAIRLLQRLTNADPQVIYDTYADVIERRGDFLSMMYAGPFVSEQIFHDYMNRAVSVMNCGSKDVGELADAYAIRGQNDEAARWLKVGLAMEGGHLLSKLGLTDGQGDAFDMGLPRFVVSEVRGFGAARQSFLDVADAYGPTFNSDEAAVRLTLLLKGTDEVARDWALTQFARADERIRQAVSKSLDILQVFELAAEAGNARAQYELAMQLRREAAAPEDLTSSAAWLLRSAEAGQADAMAEYGFALGFGLGVEQDAKLALIWLQKAQGLGSARARAVARMVQAMEQD